jgi:signal transduction histidine kinase
MIALVFGGLTAVVFVLDARSQLGANVPLLYIVPTLVTIWHSGRHGLVAPAICTALTIARVFWFPSGDWSLGLFNRALTTVALWSTAILLVQFKEADARLRAQAETARFGEMAMVIAHELRNALAGIRTAIDVFGARLSNSERDQDVRSEMNRRVQSLEHFVADLLTLSRPVRPALARRPLMPVVRRAVDALKSDPLFSGITVDTESTDAAAFIDDTLIESALVHCAMPRRS